MKVSGPLMSLEAKGKIGERLVFSKRASGQQARFQKAQKDVITSKRVIQRLRYHDGVTAWRALSVSQRLFYNLRAKDLKYSGFNLFMRELYLRPCGSYTVTGQDGLTYGTVLGADGKCWLDRNLGATQVATSSTDSSSYGDLYQWGRLKDGHQIITSGTTPTLSPTDNPGHDDFILDGNVSPYDWRSPQNNNLWQGVNGTNNVCPAGFRPPTQAEWSTLVSAENITNSASAFSSSLKLPVAGIRGHSSGGVGSRGSYGYYWSSRVTGVYAYSLYFNASAVNPANDDGRANGFSVRCVKD